MRIQSPSSAFKSDTIQPDYRSVSLSNKTKFRDTLLHVANIISKCIKVDTQNHSRSRCPSFRGLTRVKAGHNAAINVQECKFSYMVKVNDISVLSSQTSFNQTTTQFLSVAGQKYIDCWQISSVYRVTKKPKINEYDTFNYVKKLLRQQLYIYSHPETDLFRSIRTHQCG